MNPGEIYDSMTPEAQDMPKSKFVREYNRLTDPRRIRSDLNRILRGKNTKREIDSVVER